MFEGQFLDVVLIVIAVFPKCTLVCSPAVDIIFLILSHLLYHFIVYFFRQSVHSLLMGLGQPLAAIPPC